MLILCAELDCNPEQVHQLVQCIIQEDILFDLARSIRKLPFKARKDAHIVFAHILRFKPANASSEDPSAISYLVFQRPEIIIELCRGYEYHASATICGNILRQALQHDSIAALILYDESKPGESAVQLKEVDVGSKQTGDGIFWDFFRWINDDIFEVGADAFTTFREILNTHKALVCQYLTINFERFFEQYNTTLIQSTSYVTKRQSIKLLGEILLDRAYYPVMTAYVASARNLDLIMELMRDPRKMIKYETFHCFKVFVANPNKTDDVRNYLSDRKAKLLQVLPHFLEDRTDDDQFIDEKSFLVRAMQKIPDPPPKERRTPDRALSVPVGA
jgi:calcium binding protein 39